MLKEFIHYFKPHKNLFFLDLFCAFFVGLTDLFLPLIVRRMINIYVPRHDIAMMVRWIIALLFIYIIKLVLNLMINYWGHICGLRIQADMRRDLFFHLQRLPVQFFDENKTGSIMSRIINDLQEISEMSHHGPENIFICSVTIIFSGILLSTINLQLTLIIFACLPISVFFVIFIRKKQLNAFEVSRSKVGEVNANVETSISGIRVTKAYTGTKTEYEKFDRANLEYVSARSVAYRYLALFNSGMLFFIDMMYLVVVLFGGIFFYRGIINAGDFVAYILYISMFLTPVKKLVDTYEQIVEGYSGFLRFQKIMHMPKELDDPNAVDVGVLEGHIKFDDVSFKYEVQNEENVIEHFSLDIKKGTTVALVGPSGAGKTTICNLIPRFYEILDGKITIDGVDIRSMTRESLRKNIGIVAQDVFLFNGTIAENISYGKPDASMQEIIEAAKAAEIHDYIMELPNGYQTSVGERGLKLSGGQRQRISIARVFLKNPNILILDEATSALDNATEMQIQKSLEKLSKGRTVLVVAHRLSTIKNADEICVLTSQGIQEYGDSKTLLEQKGLYYDLYQYQFSSLNPVES